MLSRWVARALQARPFPSRPLRRPCARFGIRRRQSRSKLQLALRWCQTWCGLHHAARATPPRPVTRLPAALPGPPHALLPRGERHGRVPRSSCQSARRRSPGSPAGTPAAAPHLTRPTARLTLRPLRPRQFRVQRSFLGVVYLKHLQSWKLVRAFIRAGGLSALVRLFTCPSMVVRAQATEAFGLVRRSAPHLGPTPHLTASAACLGVTQITNHPGFDWLKTPSYGPDQDLFAAMASLLQEDIVGRCIANYDNPYPSASMQCLEVRCPNRLTAACWARGGGAHSSSVPLDLGLLGELDAQVLHQGRHPAPGA